MFMEMGELPADEAPALTALSRERLANDLASGDYVGWIAENQGEVIAAAGVLLHPYYPSRANPRGRPAAYILNVYTQPQYRRQGVASRLIGEILAWCREHDIARAALHASETGRLVYERLGFKAGNEMTVGTTSDRSGA
jgi:GNAT superfamily N-acetyltransferase